MPDRTAVLSSCFAIVAFAVSLFPAVSAAAPFAEGPKKCQECHESEYQVWEGTEHAKAYAKFHKHKDAKKIVAAVGGKSVKREATCQVCHYTMVQAGAGKRASPKAGPSCESCHGPSSDWRDVHNNYGGPSVKAADETPANKKKRIANARRAGMVWSFMRYDIASACMRCHGLAHPDLDAGDLAKMLDAGHPIEPDFEVVQYSQGSVRHRFYPPDITKNKPMDKAGLARFFVEGQMAKLVSATEAAGKTDNAKFVAAQKERASDARAALGKVKGVSGMQAFLSKPTHAAARQISESIQDKDLSGSVGRLLPSPGSYK